MMEFLFLTSCFLLSILICYFGAVKLTEYIVQDKTAYSRHKPDKKRRWRKTLKKNTDDVLWKNQIKETGENHTL